MHHEPRETEEWGYGYGNFGCGVFYSIKMETKFPPHFSSMTKVFIGSDWLSHSLYLMLYGFLAKSNATTTLFLQI